MKNNKQYITILLCLFVLACKTSKQPVSVALQTMTKEERLGNILQSGIQYNRLSSNLKLNVQSGKKTNPASIDAQLRIVKGEAIQLSLRIPVLGSEAFRMLITPNKVLVIDRIHKQYLSENLQAIKMQAPFDFDYYSLEALLTNRLFIAGKKEIDVSDYSAFKIQEDQFSVDISYIDRQDINYDFSTDYSNRIQTARMAQKKWEADLQCTYANWGLISDKRMFPMNLNLQLNKMDETHQMNFFHKSIEIDADFTIDSSIPAKYRQVTLQQLIELIKNLL